MQSLMRRRFFLPDPVSIARMLIIRDEDEEGAEIGGGFMPGFGGGSELIGTRWMRSLKILRSREERTNAPPTTPNVRTTPERARRCHSGRSWYLSNGLELDGVSVA